MKSVHGQGLAVQNESVVDHIHSETSGFLTVIFNTTIKKRFEQSQAKTKPEQQETDSEFTAIMKEQAIS